MPDAKKADPNEGLADDASLATDIGDGKERQAEQLEYYGGDTDDTDTADLDGLDRGDAVTDPDADEDKSDEDDEAEEKEGDEASEDEDESEGDSEEDADDDADADSEDESADDSDADGDDSDGDEADSEDDSADSESDADAKGDRGIPRHRFNEVNERMKRAEAKIEQLEKTDQAEDDAAEDKFDFDAAEKEYIDLTLDGKTEEATAKRREIRAAERVEFVAAAKAETKGEVSQEAMQNTVDSLAVQAEDMFPEFNPKSDDYNPNMVRKVSTYMRGYQADGLKADDALVAAIADVAEQYKLGATESQSDEDTKDEDEGDKKPVVKKGKKINKTKEKLKLAEQQGKSPAGEGKGSADAGAVVPNIDQMSDEEIDALPAETLARIRGDYVE